LRKVLKYGLVVGLTATLLVFAACQGGPTPEQVAEFMRSGVEKLENLGVLDAEEVEAVMGVIRASVTVLYENSSGWLEDLLKQGATAIVTLVTGYLGIRKWRGTPENRTGASPPGR